MEELIKKYNFRFIQLHGSESPEYCSFFKTKGISVLKAFSVDESIKSLSIKGYINSIDYILFDTKTKKYGGSGKHFDWKLLNEYKYEIPFFLSGGISEQDVKKIKNIQHPQFIGVDINGQFEIEAGNKSSEKVKNFIQNLRK